MFVYPFKRSRPFLLRPPYRYVTILHALIKLLISVSYPASKGYFSGLNALLLLVNSNANAGAYEYTLLISLLLICWSYGISKLKSPAIK